MTLASLPIFFGAFLLFLAQPLFVQTILPKFGGGAPIWITCTVVFQTLLLMGYSYADWITRHTSRTKLIHCLLLISTGLFCWFHPIFPDSSFTPIRDQNPIIPIFNILLTTIAIPFFTLSTTSSIIQSLLASKNYKGSVYRLFALSNMASLLALIAYPFIFEPLFALSTRKNLWQQGLLIYLVLILFFIIQSRQKHNSSTITSPAPIEKVAQKPSTNDKLLWTTLSLCSSAFLSATTYVLTQDISPIPLLWLLPLSIYLLTFIVSFNSKKMYSASFWGSLLFKITTLWFFLQFNLNIIFMVTVLSLILWVVCYICHFELVVLKPEQTYLTQFYFFISLGGAIGSLFSGIIVPITIGYTHLFPICLFSIFVFLMLRISYQQIAIKITTFPHLSFKTLYKKEIIQTSIFLILLLSSYLFTLHQKSGRPVAQYHNFYGSLNIADWNDTKHPATFIRTLVHGSTLHGFELFSPKLKQHEATGYFAPKTGIGTLFDTLHQSHSSIQVGIIGMGVGTLSAYMHSGDTLRFYEINPAMPLIANTHFSYMQEAAQRGATILTVMGDGRLSVEAETKNATIPSLDVLILDAFDGDSIPAHLLTQEALSLYKKRLKTSGTLLLHMSNRHIDLKPIAAHMAQQLGWKKLLLSTLSKKKTIDTIQDSEWAVMSADENVINALVHHPNAESLELNAHVQSWTDDHTSLHCLWKAFPCGS